MLNNLSKELIKISISIKENKDNKYEIINNVKDLYSLIVSDFINYWVVELKNKNYDKEYFEQITSVLFSTKEFVKDIKNIRQSYFIENEHSFLYYDYIPKDEKHIKQINVEVEAVLKKYNLYPRWKNWIYSLLYFDLNKNFDKTKEFIPKGLPGILRKIVENGIKTEIKEELLLYGDETEEDMVYLSKRYGKNFSTKSREKRRKPISNFERDLMWYKLYQEGKKPIEILNYDLKNRPDYWNDFKDYKKYQNDDSVEILPNGRTKAYMRIAATNIIYKGINNLKTLVKRLK